MNVLAALIDPAHGFTNDINFYDMTHLFKSLVFILFKNSRTLDQQAEQLQ